MMIADLMHVCFSGAIEVGEAEVDRAPAVPDCLLDVATAISTCVHTFEEPVVDEALAFPDMLEEMRWTIGVFVLDQAFRFSLIDRSTSFGIARMTSSSTRRQAFCVE